VDEHGCVFRSTQAGGEDDGRLAASRPTRTVMGPSSSVTWFRFEAFPRRQKQFTLELSEQSQWRGSATIPPKPVEFTLKNPAAQTSPKNWVAEPLPIKHTEEGVSFILTGVGLQTNSNFGKQWFQDSGPWKIEPTFVLLEDGQPTHNWTVEEMELYDSSGNFAGNPWSGAPILCPREDAWKLRVRCFGSEESHYASNTTWTLRGLEIPGAGKFTNVNMSQSINGVMVKVLGLAGVGKFDYAYGGHIVAWSVPKEPVKEDTLQIGNNYTLQGKTPHLSIELGEMSADERLTVRATDNQGREFYGYDLSPMGGQLQAKFKSGEVHYIKNLFSQKNWMFICFDLPSDSKKIDVTFCLHVCRAPEFIFKPLSTEAATNQQPKSDLR
jgi:hypothetical protein